jgi:hypothetical protein
MRCPEKVLILVDSEAHFRSHPYLMRFMAEEWARHGATVAVTERVDRALEADLVVSHIDLTVVPDDYRRCLARAPRVVNGRALDISKRRISRQLLTAPGDDDGPVIVKTHLNCGAAGELATFARRGPLARLLIRGAKRLPWWVTGLLTSANYPVFPHSRAVPWAVWRNPYLVVEKFRPEMRDGLYCLRTYLFMGDREVHTLACSHAPCVKAGNVIRQETIENPPDALRALRRTLEFDFGKFDYAIVDGEVVLYDCNAAPSFVDATSERARATTAELARGIAAFVSQAGADRPTGGELQEAAP